MEKRIYGPDGTVARRIVAAGGPSTSTVWKDPDSGKTYVHRVTDAAPALKMAAAARDINPTTDSGRLRGYMPENDYFKLIAEARRESKAGADYKQTVKRKLDAYFRENTYLAV